MAKKPWMFGENFIANALGHNVDKTVKVSTWHLGALNVAKDTYPDFIPYYDEYKTEHDIFINLVNTEGSDVTGRKADVKGLVELLVQLSSTDVEEMDRLLVKVYKRKSTEFLKVMPSHAPMQTGSQESRIGGVAQVLKNIGTDAALDELKAYVILVHDALVAADSEKSGDKYEVSAEKSPIHEAIDTIADMQFINYGRAVAKWSKYPSKISALFDLINLQQHPFSGDKSGLIPEGPAKKVVIHLPKPGEMYEFLNDGEGTWVVYSSRLAKLLRVGGQIVAPDEYFKIAPSVIGLLTNKFIMIQMITLGKTGHYQFSIVKPPKV
jgi:hypothetical protein